MGNMQLKTIFLKLDHWGTVWKKSVFSPLKCQTLVKIFKIQKLWKMTKYWDPRPKFTQIFFYQNDSEWAKTDFKRNFKNREIFYFFLFLSCLQLSFSCPSAVSQQSLSSLSALSLILSHTVGAHNTSSCSKLRDYTVFTLIVSMRFSSKIKRFWNNWADPWLEWHFTKLWKLPSNRVLIFKGSKLEIYMESS